MLSHNEIISKINSSHISIFENFDVDNKISVELGEQLERAELDEKIKSKNLMNAARLSITLGPVIKRERKIHSSKKRFKDNKYWFNLLNAKDKIYVQPKETINVLSNEYIRFDGSVAALIMPRLTLTDVGLSLVPTYIDPFWDGILQMKLINHTATPLEIKLGEKIAQCFFFEVKGEVDEIYKRDFPRKSHHYGQNWHKILNEDAEPFPTKKKRYIHQYMKILRLSLKTIGNKS